MTHVTLKCLCTIAFAGMALPLAANQATIDTLKKEFSGVRALDLPARAASVVASAKAADRQEVATDTVRAALAVNASSAPLVVGSVARANPDAAAVSALTAASLQPKQLSRITKAAVGGAPSEVETIVAALVKAQPASFYTIGISAADVAANSGDSILRGISSSVPALKVLIARANPNASPVKDARGVASVLKRVENMVAWLSKSDKISADTLLAGNVTPELTAKLAAMPVASGVNALSDPTIGPPYTPGGPSFGEPPIDGAKQTFPGPGRNYSGP